MVRTSIVLSWLALLQGIASADGDVRVTVTAEGDLAVVGNAQRNRLRFELEGGVLQLHHSAGTINGRSSSYAVAPVRGRFLVDLGNGDDSLVIMQAFVADHIEIRFGEGDDHCDVESLGRTLRLDLGNGDDQINLEEADFESTLVLGGAGADRVSLAFFDGVHFVVRAGAGDDRAIVRGSSLSGRCTLDGGPGTDGLWVDETAFESSPKVVGFESRAP